MAAATGRQGVAALAYLTLPFAASLMLAACAAGLRGANPSGSAPSASASAPSAAGESATAARAESKTGETQAGVTQSWPQPENPTETASLPPQLAVPDRLKGMTGGAVAGLLGPPMLVRRDEPGEVWQYVSQSCVLDLFLYRPEGRGSETAARGAKGRPILPAAGEAAKEAAEAAKDHTVVYYEIRNREGAPTASKACLSTLVAANRARPSG